MIQRFLHWLENRSRRSGKHSRSGFTLIELLVVLFIVGLLSAATLPIIVPTLSQREVQEGSRILQQALINARFAAISTGRSAGVRLLPDPVFSGPDEMDPFKPLAFNRVVQLEPAPDYSDGQLRVESGGVSEDKIVDYFIFCAANGETNWQINWVGQPPNGSRAGYQPNGQPHGNQDVFLNFFPPMFGTPGFYADPRVVVRQYKSTTPTEPTSWSWNIRAGDHITIGTQNKSQYVIAGPIAPYSFRQNWSNPEKFINLGMPAEMIGYQLPTTITDSRFPMQYHSEIMYVVNEGNRLFDGVDNNGDGVVDPAFNGLDDDGNSYIDDPAEIFFSRVVNPVALIQSLPATLTPDQRRKQALELLKQNFEWDPFVLSIGAADSSGVSIPQEYTIKRRMVPAVNASEVGLPADVVIDATTAVEWNDTYKTRVLTLPNIYATSSTLSERSRLPIDPITLYVDIVFQPDGQVVTNAASSVNNIPFQVPFYHLWLTDRADVFSPTDPRLAAGKIMTPRLPIAGGLLQSDHMNVSSTEWELRNERRLITIQTRTGRITSQTLEIFDSTNQDLPFNYAQKGLAEVPQ